MLWICLSIAVLVTAILGLALTWRVIQIIVTSGWLRKFMAFWLVIIVVVLLVGCSLTTNP